MQSGDRRPGSVEYCACERRALRTYGRRDGRGSTDPGQRPLSVHSWDLAKIGGQPFGVD